MNDTIFKNKKLLEEDSRIDDLFDYQQNVQDFESVLKQIDESATIGLIGQYGSGKSTLLFQLENKFNEEYIWVNFDAWSHPDRKDLWDGFIMSIAQEVGENTKEDAVRKVDGRQRKDFELITTGLKAIAGVVGVSIDSIVSLFQKQPAHRISEMQEILANLINKQEKPLIVVAEDVDRSGREGMYFLETLHSFIKNTKLTNKVIVIAPIGTNHYNKHDRSYLKCLDYIEFFKPKVLIGDKFIENIFEDALFQNEGVDDNDQVVWRGDSNKGLLKSFFQYLFDTESTMTIRRLKTILRQTSISFKRQTIDGYKPDWRITLGIEASKFFKEPTSNTSRFDDETNSKKIEWHVLQAYVCSIKAMSYSIYDPNTKKLNRPAVGYKFVERQNNDSSRYPSYPWFYNGRVYDNDSYYCICDFYLKY